MRKELFPFVGYISNPKSSVGGKRVSSAQGTRKVESKIQQEPDLWGRNSSNSDVLTPGSFSMFEVSPRTEAASFALPLKAIFCFQRQGGPVSFSGFSLSKFLKPMTIAPRVLSPVAMMLLRLWGAQCSKRLNKGHRLSQPIAGRVKMQGEKFLVCWVDVFCLANHWSMTDCLLLAVSVPWPWPCPPWACFIFRDFWLLKKKLEMQSVDVTCPQETDLCRHHRELPILKSHW